MFADRSRPAPQGSALAGHRWWPRGLQRRAE